MKKTIYIALMMLLSNIIFSENIHPNNPNQRAWYNPILKVINPQLPFNSNKIIPTSDRLNIIKNFICNNPIILEAGAFIGDDTVKFNEKWPEATIFSFEPNPVTFLKLRNNTQHIKNSNIFNLALNTYNGTATFYSCLDEWEGSSSLLESSPWMKNNYKGPKIIVPCVILDDWCKDNNINFIDFMWLDMEGAELYVLKSSPTILHNTKVIYSETNFKEYRKGMTRFNDLKNFLEKNDFCLIAHWWLNNVQGDAIFVKKSLLVSITNNNK
jgi:2-O-methyltransferase